MLRLLPAAVAGLGLLVNAQVACGQSSDAQKEIHKPGRETLARAEKTIESAVDAKVSLEVDAASFGGDSKSWSNLNIIANRVVAALSEVGKDQVGKDAIARNVSKVVIVKLAEAATADSADLNGGTLTVRTQGTDDAVALLQGVITRTVEKLLPAQP